MNDKEACADGQADLYAICIVRSNFINIRRSLSCFLLSDSQDYLPTGYFFMLSCHLLMLFEINFFENSFRNTIRVSNRLIQIWPDIFFCLDLGSNCLRNFSDLCFGGMIQIVHADALLWLS